MAYSAEDEAEIEKAAEARHRAFKKNQEWLAQQKRDAECKAGNHSALDAERKCSNCKEKVAEPAPPKKKSLLAM